MVTVLATMETLNSASTLVDERDDDHPVAYSSDSDAAMTVGDSDARCIQRVVTHTTDVINRTALLKNEEDVLANVVAFLCSSEHAVPNEKTQHNERDSFRTVHGVTRSCNFKLDSFYTIIIASQCDSIANDRSRRRRPHMHSLRRV